MHVKIFIRIACHIAEIDKNLDFFSHIPMYAVKHSQTFGSSWKLSPGGAIGEKNRNKQKMRIYQLLLTDCCCILQSGLS